jgi:hypothetical protein
MVAFLRDSPAPRPLLLVEKTDRLYRNIKDWVTVEDLGVDVHLVKEGVILISRKKFARHAREGGAGTLAGRRAPRIPQ